MAVVSLQTLIVLFTFIRLISGSSLLDFSAARHDDPSIIGLRDLETTEGNYIPDNTDDLYIKLGTDPKGTAALHFHHIKGDLRVEYHALNKKTEANKTYYIGYKFSLAEVHPKSLIIWQFKEYKANNAKAGGANIPLHLTLRNGVLQFDSEAGWAIPSVVQWSTTVKPNTVYSVGLVINTSTPGSVKFYWNGGLQTFTDGKQKLSLTTFPGRSDPKFGAYGGVEEQIDTYVYDIQIGTTLNDIKRAAGL